MLRFLVSLFFLSASVAAQAGKLADPSLVARIEQLLHSVLTSNSDSNSAEDAQIREIFTKRGLPTVREVGDAAAYDFVLLLTSEDLLLDMQPQVRPRIQAAVAAHDLPPDAGVFYESRLRAAKIKQSARTRAPENPGLVDQIERMSRVEQQVRQQKDLNAAKLAETDARHALALQEILNRYGVPTYAMVGPQAADDFIIMIQHQPPRFRQQVLPKLKSLVDAGQADPGSYALVYDLSQRDMGMKQLYGERLECQAGEAMHEAPIEDEAHVNQRRAELGLIRIELYARLVAEMMPQFCPPAPKRSE
jgi:hypothetical protein